MLTNNTIDTTPRQILYVLYGMLGFMPFLFVAGLDSPDLLPRLLWCQLGTLFILLYWLYSGATWNHSPFYLPILIYFTLMILSTFWAITPFRSVHLLSKHITFFCFFFCLSNLLQKKHIPSVLVATSVAGGVVSFYGILEYHNIIPQWIPSTGRPSSTFMFRNLAAHYLVVNLPLAGLLFFLAKTNKSRYISSISAVLMFVFLLYTRTRGAWVGLFCATTLTLILWFVCHRNSFFRTIRASLNKNTRIFVVVSLLTVIILGPLPAGFRDQHIQRFDEKKADISSAVTSIFKKGGDRGRTKMWHHTLTMVQHNPQGVGFGNWEFAYPLYDRGEQISPDTTPRRPHNDLLWIASEIGIMGILAYLCILLYVLLGTIRIWQKSTSFSSHIIACLSCISIFAMVGDGIFNFPYERIPPSMLFWLAISFIVICHKETLTNSKSNYPTFVPKLLLPLLIAALLITLKNIAFDYHYIRAVRATLQNNTDLALKEARAALDYGPFNHQVLVIYGRALKEQKKYVEAEQAFYQALEYHPYFSNIYNNIGHLYDDWGRWKQATQAYQKAITLLPNHHKAMYNSGIIFEKQGLLDSAKTAYQKAIKQNNDFGKAYHNLAGIFNKQNQPDSAHVYYLKALSAVNPTHESYFNLGNLFAQQHRYDQAIQAYNAFINNWQGDEKWHLEAHKALSEAYSGLGVQKEQQGEFAQALTHYQTAIEHWPENPMNWYNKGNVYRQQNNTQQAISAYQVAIEKDATFTDAYNNLGLIYTAQKQYNSAIEAFQKAIKTHPHNAILSLNLGNAYLGKGDIYRAISTYETFLSLWDKHDATKQQVQNVLKELKAATQ